MQRINALLEHSYLARYPETWFSTSKMSHCQLLHWQQLDLRPQCSHPPLQERGTELTIPAPSQSNRYVYRFTLNPMIILQDIRQWIKYIIFWEHRRSWRQERSPSILRPRSASFGAGMRMSFASKSSPYLSVAAPSAILTTLIPAGIFSYSFTFLPLWLLFFSTFHHRLRGIVNAANPEELSTLQEVRLTHAVEELVVFEEPKFKGGCWCSQHQKLCDLVLCIALKH